MTTENSKKDHELSKELSDMKRIKMELEAEKTRNEDDLRKTN
jgi:hypothetical protein